MSELDYVLRVYRPEYVDDMYWIYVDSPTVSGLHVCGSTAERALAAAPAMIERLRKDNGCAPFDNGHITESTT